MSIMLVRSKALTKLIRAISAGRFVVLTHNGFGHVSQRHTMDPLGSAGA